MSEVCGHRTFQRNLKQMKGENYTKKRQKTLSIVPKNSSRMLYGHKIERVKNLILK